MEELPAALRTLFGCASVLVGDAEDASLVTLNVLKRSVAFYFSPDFAAPLTLFTRITTVYLRDQHVRDQILLDESIVLSGKLDTPEGIPSETFHPWDERSVYIKRIANELPEPDKQMAEKVFYNFVVQCERYANVTIQMPALRIPRGADLSQYGYDRSKHPAAIRLDAVMDRLDKVQQDIEDCFRATTP